MRRIVGKITRNGYESGESNAADKARLTEMFAAQSAPGLETDTGLFQGFGYRDPLEGVPEMARPLYETRAKQAGINIDSKRYFGSIADSPGDPKAWQDNRGDCERVLVERGMGSKGVVNTETRIDAAPSDHYEPAADIVEDRAIDIMADAGATDQCSLREWNDAKDKARTSLLPDYEKGI